jgi:hypothetical protein
VGKSSATLHFRQLHASEPRVHNPYRPWKSRLDLGRMPDGPANRVRGLVRQSELPIGNL